MTRFRFVSDHAEEYGVKRLCSTLKVSRSGYYDWKRRPPSKHARARCRARRALIAEIHQRSRTTYGAPRVHAELRRLDQRCGKKAGGPPHGRPGPGRAPMPAGSGAGVAQTSLRRRTW